MSDITAYNFLANADAQEIISVLQKAYCKTCNGTGESNDAGIGDMYCNTWVCGKCEGKGWNNTALREIIAAAPDAEVQP